MNRRKGRRNSPLFVQSVRNKFLKGVEVHTDRRTENSFIVTVNNNIYKRIYKIYDEWFLWDEKLGFRTKVKNFTSALRIVEDSLKNCVV